MIFSSSSMEDNGYFIEGGSKLGKNGNSLILIFKINLLIIII